MIFIAANNKHEKSKPHILIMLGMTPPPDPICVFFGVVVPPVGTPSRLGNWTFLVSNHDSTTHSSKRLLTRIKSESLLLVQ